MRISQEFQVRCGGQPHRIFLTTAGQLVLPDHPVADREKQAAMALLGGTTCECVSALTGWKTRNAQLIPESMMNAFGRRMSGNVDVQLCRRIRRKRNRGRPKAINRTSLNKIVQHSRDDKWGNNVRNMNAIATRLESELQRRGYQVAVIENEFIFGIADDFLDADQFFKLVDILRLQAKKFSGYGNSVSQIVNSDAGKDIRHKVFCVKPLSSNARGHGVIEFDSRYGSTTLTINKGTSKFITISEMADLIEDDLYCYQLNAARERCNQRQDAEFDNRLKRFTESVDDRLKANSSSRSQLRLAIGHVTTHASVDLRITVENMTVQGAERFVRKLEQIVPDLLGIQRGTTTRYVNPQRYPQGRRESVGGKPLGGIASPEQPGRAESNG